MSRIETIEDGCCVYVICFDADKGPSKVGIAASPRKRMATLQTAHYQKLFLAGTIPTPDRLIARELESSFHQVQKDHRLSGEWFDIPPGQCLAMLLLSLVALLHECSGWTEAQINELSTKMIRHLEGA